MISLVRPPREVRVVRRDRKRLRTAIGNLRSVLGRFVIVGESQEYRQVKQKHGARSYRESLRKLPWFGHTKTPNVRGHRADGMKDATGGAASEAPGGPRC